MGEGGEGLAVVADEAGAEDGDPEVARAVFGEGPDPAVGHAVVGDRPAVLRVLAENPRAVAFYAKHGFAAVGAPEPMTGPWAGLHEQLMVRRRPHDGGAA